MTNPQVYKNAALRVESGWVQGQLDDGLGRVCLVGSLSRDGHLDRVKRAEIDRSLSKYPLYRVLKLLTQDPDASIMAWNDMPWRRQGAVVNVLRDTASAVETQWLRDERSKLQVQITRLEQERDALRARVDRLEKENVHLWKRIRAVRQLGEDRDALRTLDAELAQRFQVLESL